MQATIIKSDHIISIKLQGRFDFNTHRVFRAAADAVLLETHNQIQVDFAGVDYLDSSALGMLLMLRDKAKAASKAVTLVNCAGGVRQVLDIANFGKLFPVS